MAQEVTDSYAEAQKEFDLTQLEKTPPQHNYFLQKKIDWEKSRQMFNVKGWLLKKC